MNDMSIEEQKALEEEKEVSTDTLREQIAMLKGLTKLGGWQLVVEHFSAVLAARQAEILQPVENFLLMPKFEHMKGYAQGLYEVLQGPQMLIGVLAEELERREKLAELKAEHEDEEDYDNDDTSGQ